MTNLKTPRIIESDVLAEAELDAAISRHFSPARYREQLARFDDTMPGFEPAHSASEISDDDDGQPVSNFGAFAALPIGLPLVIAAWAVIGAIAALAWWLL